MLRRKPVRFEVLEIVEGADPRRLSREIIAEAVGEPLA
jgi:hypothetical protein